MSALPETGGSKRPHRSIENFRGDFEALAQLMRDSWSENKSQPLLYTAAYLSSYFSDPGATPELAPALYQDSQMVGFVAGFPRRVYFRGKRLRLIISAFLTVAREHKKSGYGIVLWSELVKRARARGYDGVISYSVDGEPMTSMLLGCYQRMNLHAARIFAVHYLTRLIPRGQSSIDSETPDPNLAESFMRAASRTLELVPLGRIWSIEEAQWNLRRAEAIVASHRDESRQGFLTGSLMPIADRDTTKCAVIDDVLWNDLTLAQSQELVRRFVARSASLGARMVVVPLQGYADPEPFLKSRFLRSPRLLHAYLGLWDPTINLGPVDSFYLDVF